jgi:lysyl-tRNA synthetase class 1
MLGDAKRDYQSALIAIESYLEAANKRFYANPIEGVKWIVRALNISLSIGSQDGARAAAGAMFNLVESDANLMNIGVWIAPFDYFYDKRDLLTAGQKAKIVSDLENILARVSVSNPETNEFDPWGAQAAAERLAQHYKGQGAKSEAERVIKSYGASFEFLAKQASPMMAMAWLQPVIERLEQENLKADAERVQNLASENGKNIASDLKTCSVKVDLDKDKVEAEIEAIVSGEQLHAALMRVADYFMPKADFARRLVEEQKKTAPLLSMITSVIVRPDGQPEAIIGSAEDDEEGRLHHQISQHMAFVQPLLRATLHRLVRKFSVSADHFVDFIFQSPIFLESRQPLIQAGMQAYLDGDFIKAIHVLVPQVEDTLRSLAAKAGIPIYKTVRGASGITDVKSMNNVLEDARVRDMLGENLWRYLTVLYIDRRGLNLRNDLAHGLVSPQSFNQLIGDRVVHSLIVLGMIRAKAPVQQASRASGDQP